MLCRSKEKELSLKTIRHRLNSVSGDANEENHINGNGESTIHPGKERSPSSPTREHSTFGTLFSPNGKGKGEQEEDGSAVPGVWLTVSMHRTFEKVKVSTRMLYVHVTYVSSPLHPSYSFLHCSLHISSDNAFMSNSILFLCTALLDFSLSFIHQQILNWIIAFRVFLSLHIFFPHSYCFLYFSILCQISVWRSIV